MDRQELQETFDHFDRDDNGRIDRDEFGEVMAALDAGMSKDELDMGFSIIDTDDNRQVDFHEFADWWARR